MDGIAYEFPQGSDNRVTLLQGERLVDEIAEEVIPALTRQAEQTLDAVGQARARQAQRDAVRDEVRAELRQNRSKGLG